MLRLIEKNYLLGLLLFIVQGVFAQFSVSATHTDETCVGNGTITISLNNTNPLAEYTFAIYKLPNTTTTYLVTSSTFIEHLAGGNYLIYAIETINGNSTQQSIEVTIEYQVEPLQFYVVETATACNGITLEVITTAGTPVSYEIFEGPNTYPLQDSNIFTGLLTDSTYNIRIYDNCGEGYVRTHTIELATSFAVVMDGGNSYRIDCDTYRVAFLIQSDTQVNNAPIDFVYYSSGGTQNYSGTVNIIEGITSTYLDIPFYADEEVTMDVSVLDCLFQQEIDFEVKMDFDAGRNECGVIAFALTMTNLVAPYTVEFLSYDGEDPFDPLEFNENHPTHLDDFIQYGHMDNPMPFGHYTFSVTDSCGFTDTISFDSVYAEEDRILGFGNIGCTGSSGYLIVKFNSDRTVVAAQIISGPDEVGPYPVVVDEFINEDGELRLDEMPAGTYIIATLDSCGFEYEDELIIEEATYNSFFSRSYVNCDDSTGTLRLATPNGGVLTQVTILSAPDGFPHPLPYNATGDLNANGVLFYPQMPPGDYIIEATDSCDYHEITTAVVNSDLFNTAPYITVNKLCNIFDLDIRPDAIASSYNATLWLQYFDETTQQWVHPYTGVAYSGGIPTEENSIKLVVTPDPELINVAIFGKFRIVKTYRTITSDSPFQTQQCIKENYYTFDYYRDLAIVNAYRIICEGQNQSVVIQAQGVPPLNYSITTKNGEPFVVNNGQNNIFTNLEPGTYNFQVTDNCGNIRNREFNLNEIELMVSSGVSDNIISCTEEGENSVEFYLPERNIFFVASTLSLNYFSFSYHATFNHAYNDTNPLGDYQIVNAGESKRIFVRIENSLVSGCFSIVYYDLIVIGTPNTASLQTDYVLCEEQEFITVSLGNLFDHYHWFDGSSSNSIKIYEPGEYWVTVGNEESGVICEQDFHFTVTLSTAPIIEKIDFVDWTNNQNSITVNVSGSGNYLYALSGLPFQSSNTFENLLPGVYTVYVKDQNGCGETSSQVLLLNYPRFFTPNSDGINDFWRIEFGIYEPDMRISIFDRYGKLIKVFFGNEPGWDGTYNGKNLFSTDYWFTVERKNGMIKRGHFSMVR